MLALCLNLEGSLILRSGQRSGNAKMTLIPPRTLVLLRSGPYQVQAARGAHLALAVIWNQLLTPLLDHWSAPRGSGRPSLRAISCRPMDPLFVTSIDRVIAASEGKEEFPEAQIVSFLYEAVPRVHAGGEEMQLSPLPSELPDTIRELTDEVRKDPAGSWPLKDASDRAGYSAFHFSRIFKSLVGYGFHEYVDRCRTETAVRLMLSSDLGIDVIAQRSGFGTTQGLRESVKEYLGLVPSEIRSASEIGTPA